MARTAKICRGSWCLGFGFAQPATLEQVVKVLSAFGYDGVELAGFFDHATVERYPDKGSRTKLVDWIHSHDLELVGYAPGPYGDFGKFPWATGGDDAVKGYLDLFEQSVQFCVDCGIPTMRVDPGDFGPLPRDADYDAAWNRVVETFKAHAQRGRELGVKMLWEYETGQIFVKPSEAVKLLDRDPTPFVHYFVAETGGLLEPRELQTWRLLHAAAGLWLAADHLKAER